MPAAAMESILLESRSLFWLLLHQVHLFLQSNLRLPLALLYQIRLPWLVWFIGWDMHPWWQLVNQVAAELLHSSEAAEGYRLSVLGPL